MTTYGYQGNAAQVARNTNGYPPAPRYAPVSKTTPLSPYASRTAVQTTGYTGQGAGTLPQQQPLAPPARPAAQPAAPAAPAASVYDYTTDPILQQVQASATRQQGDADAAALTQRKQLAIQYGDPELANQLGDTATAQAAAANPYSVYGLLASQMPKDQAALDEGLNKNNLFYSGARVNQQGELANTYGQHRAEAAGAEQTALGGIEQQRLGAYMAAQQAVQQANSDAYTRYLQQLLANPPALGGGGGDQGGGDQSPLFANEPGAPEAATAMLGGVGNVGGDALNLLAGMFGGSTAKPKTKPQNGYGPGGKIRT